jgi:hypothetical protein
MQQPNFTDKDDADAVSLDELLSDTKSALSSERIRRASDQANVGRDLNIDDITSAVINKKQQNNISLEQFVPTIDNKHSDLSDDDSYYSLQRLLERRRGVRDEDSKLSRRVRQFYKDQDELIDVYERVYNRGTAEGDDDIVEKQQQHTVKMANIFTKVSFGANLVCISYLIRSSNFLFLQGFIYIENCCCCCFKVSFSYFISDRFSC